MTVRTILLFTATMGAVLFPVAPASAQSTFDFGRVDARVQESTVGGLGQPAAALEFGDSNGHGAASGSLRDGKVHARAESLPDGVSSCPPYEYSCYWNVSAQVGMKERITFTADQANAMGGVLNYAFDFDGFYDKGRWYGGGGASATWYLGTSFTGLITASWHDLDPAVPLHISGSIDISDGATVYMSLGLAVSAGRGATMDFGNTGKFSWVVPEGYHYTSSTGAFMTDAVPAVPEPATWAMLIAGFGGIGAVARRARPRRMGLPGAEALA